MPKKREPITYEPYPAVEAGRFANSREFFAAICSKPGFVDEVIQVGELFGSMSSGPGHPTPAAITAYMNEVRKRSSALLLLLCEGIDEDFKPASGAVESLKDVFDYAKLTGGPIAIYPPSPDILPTTERIELLKRLRSDLAFLVGLSLRGAAHWNRKKASRKGRPADTALDLMVRSLAEVFGRFGVEIKKADQSSFIECLGRICEVCGQSHSPSGYRALLRYLPKSQDS